MPRFTVLRITQGSRKPAANRIFQFFVGLAALLCQFGIIASPAKAADDTFACIDGLYGELVHVTGTSYVENDWFDVANGTRLDARGDAFTAQTLIADSTKSKYPIDIRSGLSTVCWAGGSVVFTDDPNATWKQRHDQNSAGVMGYDTNLIADGVRVHNAEDSFRPFWTRDSADVSWQVRNSWVSYNRDDCIEADWIASGTADDNLFDGCYVFFSATWTDTIKRTFTITNNLVHLQKMPGPNGWDDPKYSGHGDLFKIRGPGPRFVLKNNIFLIEGYTTTDWNVDGQPDNSATALAFKNLDGCSGNTIVWMPPASDPTAPFPGKIPNDPSCVTVTSDMSVWENAKQAWIDAHPNVMRLPNDPAPTQNTVTDTTTTTTTTDPATITDTTTAADTTTTTTTDTTSTSSTDATITDSVTTGTITTTVSTTTDDTQPPDVAIISPAPGSKMLPATKFSIDVSATDNVAVARLEVSVDRNAPTVFEGSGTHSFTWEVDTSRKLHVIRARAYDASGNTAATRSWFLTAR